MLAAVLALGATAWVAPASGLANVSAPRGALGRAGSRGHTATEPSSAHVVLAGGASAYTEATTVLSASAGGIVFSALSRNGAGQLARSPSYWVVATASTPAKSGGSTPPAPVLSHLPVPSSGTYVDRPGSELSIAGSMVSALEQRRVGRRTEWQVLTDDLSKDVVRVRNLESGATWQGASPTGWLETTPARSPAEAVALSEVNPATGKVRFLGSLRGKNTRFIAGTSAVVATETDPARPADSIVEYLRYSAPRRWHVLADSPGVWHCTSVTAASVGCVQAVVGVTGESAVESFSLDGGAPIVAYVTGPAGNVRALVTPSYTSWSYCHGSSCTLRRLPDDGGPAVPQAIPDGQTAAGGAGVVWGSPATSAAASGIFSEADDAAAPSQLVASPRSPLDTAAISVAPGSVIYVDNALPGLPVLRQSFREVGGLSVSPPTRLGFVGYLAPGGTAAGVSLADGGSAAVFSIDDPAGGAEMGLRAVDSSPGGSRLVTAAADATTTSELGQPVTVSGQWVAWMYEGTCELEHLPSGTRIAWRARGLVACTIGAGRLAWLSSRGGVYDVHMGRSGPEPLSTARTVSPLLAAGSEVMPGARLLLGGTYVAWDFSVSSAGSRHPAGVAGYVDLAKTAKAVSLRHGSEVAAVTGTYLATTRGASGYPTVKNLVTGKVVRLAVYGRSLSIGGDVAGWIGQDGRPRIVQLPS
ncbi:MAG: hypothetical protein ACRDZ6_05645 [Acidimicrobiales bacterium]